LFLPPAAWHDAAVLAALRQGSIAAFP